MAERRITVCDYPGCDRDDAENYEISRDADRRWQVDLCEVHAKPLIDIGEMGQERVLPRDQVTNPKVLHTFGPLVKMD